MDASRRRIRHFNWKLALVLVLAVAVVAGTMIGLRRWRRVNSAGDALQAGLAAYDAKDWNKAAQQLGRYIALRPRENLSVLVKYGNAQLRVVPQREANIRQAITAYHKVLQEIPDHPEASDNLSRVYLMVGRPGEAEIVLRRRLAAGDDVNARQLLAMCLENQRMFMEAADQLQDIIRSNPDRVAAYQLLANLMRERNDEVPGSPVDTLGLAVKNNPASAAARIALGAYLDTWVDTPEARAQAREEYAAASRLDLSDAQTRVRLAERYLAISDYRSAREQLSAAAKSDPSMLSLWTTWAEVVRRGCAPAEASVVANDALAALGTSRVPYLPTAGELYLYAGDAAKARQCLDELKEKDALSPDILLLEGLIAQRQGNNRQAIRFWRQAVANGNASAKVRLALAQAYDSINDIDSAVRELRNLATDSPEDNAVRLGLISALCRAGSWREAAGYCAEALKRQPNNVDLLLADLNIRAHLASASGDAAGAWSDIDSHVAPLKSRFPGNARVSVLEGEIMLLKGDYAGAEAIGRLLAAQGTTAADGVLIAVEAMWGSGRRKDAIATLADYVRKSSAGPARIEQLADLMLRDGQVDAAVAEVDGAAKAASSSNLTPMLAVQARLYQRIGRTEDAVRIYKSMAAADPDDVDSRGMIFKLVGDADPALSQRMVDEIKGIDGPGSPRHRYLQAQLWLNSREWEARMADTRSLLGENLKQDPHDMRSMMLLGLAHQKSGNLRLAIDTLRSVYRETPDSPDAVFHLVSALQKAGELDAAGRILDAAAARSIGTVNLEGLRLSQHLRRGDVESAMATAQEMLRRYPGNSALAVFVARIKVRQKDISGARAILDRMDQNDANVLMTRAELLIAEGRGDEALRLCDSFVESTGGTLALLFRAHARTAVRDLDAAQKDYEEIARREPAKPQSWINLSDFLSARGNTAEATRVIERAMKVDPVMPGIAIRAVRLYSLSADPAVRKKADSTLDAAIAANPGDADLGLLKSQALISRGTSPALEEARGILDRITSRNPGRIDAWILAGQTALMEGLPESVLEAVSRGLAAGPDKTQRRALLMLESDAKKLRWPSLAVSTLKGLYDSDRDDVEVALALAKAYRKADQPRDAVSLLQDLRGRAAPADADKVEMALIDALDDAGDRDGALARARKLAESALASTDSTVSPADPRPTLLCVQLLARAGRWDEASTLVRQWAQGHADDVSTPMAAAGIFLQEAASDGRGAVTPGARDASSGAEAMLLDAISAHSRDARPKAMLALFYQTGGQVDKAVDYYRKALADAPRDAASLNNLAWLLCEEKHRPEDALPLADRGRSLYPDNAMLMDTRGVIYHKLMRLDDARKELEMAARAGLRGAPSTTSAEYHLARVIADQGNTQEAATRIRDLLERTTLRGKLSPEEQSEAKGILSKLSGPRL